MMKRYLFILFAIFFIFTNSKCKKPNATVSSNPKPQSNNSIKATIDGVEWQTNDKGIVNKGLHAEYYLSMNDFALDGSDLLSGPFDEMYIYTKNIQLNVAKNFGRGGSASFAVFHDESKYYSTNDTLSGSITFTSIDTINLIVNGTFYFSAIDSITGKIIKVENGIIKNAKFIYQ